MAVLLRYAPARQLFGVGLVELMITLVLGALITAGTISLFSANRQSFRLQDNLAQAQESGSFALDFIARDIRRAGYPGEKDNNFAAFHVDVAATATRNDVVDTRARTINGAVVNVNFVDDQLAIVFKPDPFLTTDCNGTTTVGGTLLTAMGADIFVSNRYWVREINPQPAAGPDRELVCQGFLLTTADDPVTNVKQLVATAAIGTPQALASGVESFQVMYGIDTTFAADLTVPGCSAAPLNPMLPTMYVHGGLLVNAFAYNRKAPSGAAGNCDKPFGAVAMVRSVRIALLVRTPATVDATVPATREYTLLNRTLTNSAAPVAPAVNFPPIADGRVRRLFLTTVALRNIERRLP